MSSINPGHLKNYFGEKDAEGNWTGKIRPLNTFTEFDLNKIVEMGFRNEEHFKLEMTKLIAIDDGNLKLKEDSQKKIDDQAFKNRFNSQLTVISNYIKNSNSSELNDFLISQGFVKGSVKKHKIWAASDKQIMNAGEKGGIFTGNEDPDLRHPDKSGNYRGGWTAEKTAKFDLMQTSLISSDRLGNAPDKVSISREIVITSFLSTSNLINQNPCHPLGDQLFSWLRLLWKGICIPDLFVVQPCPKKQCPA